MLKPVKVARIITRASVAKLFAMVSFALAIWRLPSVFILLPNESHLINTMLVLYPLALGFTFLTIHKLYEIVAVHESREGASPSAQTTTRQNVP